MAVKYEQIPTVKLAYAKCMKPNKMPEILHLDDDAMQGLFDFSVLKPATLNENDTLEDAMDTIKSTGQHLILVIDDSKHIIGILRSEDIQGQKPYQIMEEKRIPRAEIPVTSLMVNYDAVLTFDYDQVVGSKIGNVVVTMQENKKRYAIVQQAHGTADDICIRGSFSISHLSHALGTDVSSELGQAESLLEMQRKFS